MPCQYFALVGVENGPLYWPVHSGRPQYFRVALEVLYAIYRNMVIPAF